MNMSAPIVAQHRDHPRVSPHRGDTTAAWKPGGSGHIPTWVVGCLVAQRMYNDRRRTVIFAARMKRAFRDFERFQHGF
jgi:hypothetical protein